MPVDVVLRTVAVMATLLLAAALLASRRQRAAVPGALFALAVAAFFLTSAPGAAEALGLFAWPLTALCVTKAVWFWLLARALFVDGSALTRPAIALAGAVALFGTWQQMVFLERFESGVAGPLESAAGSAFDGVLAAFVILGLYTAWRDLGADLVERRRRLRLGFIVATGAYLAMTLAVQAANVVLHAATPLPLARANMLLVTAVCLAAAASLTQVRTGNWLVPARPAPPGGLSRLEAAILAQLERLMEQERVYLEEGLTIGALARRLGTGEHVVRRVIHRGLGYRNFNDFLHAFRIRAACDALARPEQARQPVLAIAMDVGYGSVGAFNRAFKARTGVTPTTYRRARLNGSSLPH